MRGAIAGTVKQLDLMWATTTIDDGGSNRDHKDIKDLSFVIGDG